MGEVYVFLWFFITSGYVKYLQQVSEPLGLEGRQQTIPCFFDRREFLQLKEGKIGLHLGMFCGYKIENCLLKLVILS